MSEQIDIWHWTWQSAGIPKTITTWKDYVVALRNTYGSSLRSLFVKVADYDGQGNPRFQCELTGNPLDPASPDDVEAIIEDLATASIGFRPWAVIRDGGDGSQATGMANMLTDLPTWELILDVEPYASFWEVPGREQAEAVCEILNDARMNLALSVDSRTSGKLNEISFQTWLASGVVNQVMPMCYWNEFGMPMDQTVDQCMTTLESAVGSVVVQYNIVLPNYPVGNIAITDYELADSIAYAMSYDNCSIFRMGAWAWDQADAVKSVM